MTEQTHKQKAPTIISVPKEKGALMEEEDEELGKDDNRTIEEQVIREEGNEDDEDVPSNQGERVGDVPVNQGERGGHIPADQGERVEDVPANQGEVEVDDEIAGSKNEDSDAGNEDGEESDKEETKKLLAEENVHQLEEAEKVCTHACMSVCQRLRCSVSL